ncbi:hypothetical protein, partial [Erwinia sp. PsM31]|uniref:hypothetical protein n=1 Tax=Erwinia sp. PsM31 TaxID=3030535 RepID=UPI00263A7A5F
RIYPQSYPHQEVRTNLDEHQANVFATMPLKNPGPHLGAFPESSLLLSLKRMGKAKIDLTLLSLRTKAKG